MHPGLHCSKGQVFFIRYRLVGLAQYVPENDDPAGPVIQRLARVLDALLYGKEALADLDDLLDDLLGAYHRGEPPWKLLFDKLGDFFDKRFGSEWKANDQEFWSEFSRTYQVGKGIQERLKHDPKIIDKGI